MTKELLEELQSSLSPETYRLFNEAITSEMSDDDFNREVSERISHR